MSGTGIVRDDLFIDHDPGEWHPESPARLEAIYRMLDSRIRPGLVTLDRRMAAKEEITLIHTPAYFGKIAQTQGRSSTYLDPDTRTSPRSFEAALAAAGGLIELVELVLKGDLDNGFALVRPPGHHAETDRAMGFCLFNNIAIAAAWALKSGGLSRVMIVDWDLHHGNGTQYAFYENPRVLYFSTHQYPYYPGSGGLNENGFGKGEGFTVNVPLGRGHGDQEYTAIFQKIVEPLARTYQPELILVSAGFDIYFQDPLGGMKVTAEGFAAMARILKSLAEELCGGRLVFTLEGGYHIEGQATGIEKVLEVLQGSGSAGEKLARSEAPEPKIVEAVRRHQASYWKF